MSDRSDDHPQHSFRRIGSLTAGVSSTPGPRGLPTTRSDGERRSSGTTGPALVGKTPQNVIGWLRGETTSLRASTMESWRNAVDSATATAYWQALAGLKPKQVTENILHRFALECVPLPALRATPLMEADGQMMGERWTGEPNPLWTWAQIEGLKMELQACSMTLPKREIMKRLITMRNTLASRNMDEIDMEDQLLAYTNMCADWPADVVHHVLRPEYHAKWFPTPDVIARDLENVGGKRRALFEAVDQFASEAEAC